MIILTNQQSKLLHLFAEGHSYASAAKALDISLACVQTHASNLRKATGIINLHDKTECLRYLGRIRHPDFRAGPTPRQLEVLRLMVAGHSRKSIAPRMGLSLGTIINAASQGRRRLSTALGERSNSHTDLQTLLRTWEEKMGIHSEPSAVTDPMF